MSPDVGRYFLQVAERVEKDGVEALREDPMGFALIYLSHHLHGKSTHGLISFARCHWDWYEQMKTWADPTPKALGTDRNIYVAPRESAKSTTWFLIAPMWAACFGHVNFVAAFANSATQAETHLSTFRRELVTNEDIRRDFPRLCKPMTRGRGATVFDTKSMYQAANEFVFAARGIDSGSLGMKVNERRPDLIILDDIEPGEANYSEHGVNQRKKTLTQDILPMSESAKVTWVGTVTRPDSLVHQAVQSKVTALQPAQWLSDGRWQVHHYLALDTDDRGSDRSLWPEKWSVGWLRSHAHERQFLMNYQNQPVPQDSAYWTVDDIRYGEAPDYPRTLISIDPAVTTRHTSDYTGIAVISQHEGTLYVRECLQVRLSPAELARKAGQLAAQYEASALVIETNQGGDTWKAIFDPVTTSLGLTYREVKNSARKEMRASWLHLAMQRGNVLLTKQIPELESQMLGFPAGLHDDMVDSISSVVAQMPHLTGQKVRGPLRMSMV